MSEEMNKYDLRAHMTKVREQIQPKLSKRLEDKDLEYVLNPKMFAVFMGRSPDYYDDPRQRRYGVAISNTGRTHDGYPVRVKWAAADGEEIYFGEKLKD